MKGKDVLTVPVYSSKASSPLTSILVQVIPLHWPQARVHRSPLFWQEQLFLSHFPWQLHLTSFSKNARATIPTWSGQGYCLARSVPGGTLCNNGTWLHRKWVGVIQEADRPKWTPPCYWTCMLFQSRAYFWDGAAAGQAGRCCPQPLPLISNLVSQS